MRRLHGIALCSLTVLLLSSGGIPTSTPAANANPTPPSSCPTGGVPAQTTITTQTDVRQAYFQNDNRLGPKDLPKRGQIGDLLTQYNRFKAMGPNKLLDCYWRVNAIPPGGGSPVTGWVYPPDDGFAPGTRHQQNVAEGRKLQLFGNPFSGKFLAPAGTVYSQEAIPPSNLDTFTNAFPFNYHLYLVCKDFQSEEGVIAPWFQQPGGGIQDFTGKQPYPFDNVGDLQKPAGPGQPPYLLDITDSPTKTTPCPSTP